MISTIFYGRNDNHGYNLHKRASLSINNMAELLTNKDDEILFVDWNTPPGLPTFIESIHDLLTDKAKKLTKIIKVDFNTHDKLYGSKTNKQTIEPVARNVAIVRSNPNNKWILSTNTDMIFIPKNSSKSLNEICAELDDGFYELPRFSIPEIIWETFDRLNPNSVIDAIKVLRTKIDLDEIITAGPILRYDAPGDFQLCLREQLFEVGGFDENMILGWHVDSNLCRRLNLLNGETKSLQDQLYGYHCEHTKVTTHFTATNVENNLVDFFERVNSPYLSSQGINWGLSDLDLKQFHVNDKILERFEILYNYSSPPVNPRTPVYANSMGYLAGYPETHAIPYVIDSIYDYPADTKILFFGHSEYRVSLYKNMFERMGFIDFVNLHKAKNSDWKITDFNHPTVVFLDLGFELGDQDISITTHYDMKDNSKKYEVDVISNFLNFVILNSKNLDLYRCPIISMNLETYDTGPGTFLKKWLQLPQVASNSRVRIGFLKKSLKNRNIDTLKRLLERTKNEIQFLNPGYFNELKFDSRMRDKQGFQISSHQVIPYSKNYSGCSITRRGLMLEKTGSIEFDVESLRIKENCLIVFELDRPRIDCNIHDLYGTIEINSFGATTKFKKNKSDSSSIKYIPEEYLNKISFGFNMIGYDSDHRAIIRLTNFGIFKLSKLRRKLLLMRSSDLRTRYFLEDNWSFSNENLRRWTTDSEFSFNLNSDKIIRSQCIAIEINYFKNLEEKHFIKRIWINGEHDDLKFIELPRVNRRRGRIIFIFVPGGSKSKVTIQTNSESFAPFEIDKRESRTVNAQVGSIGVADGNLMVLSLFLLFPIFILWVKVIKALYDVKNVYQGLAAKISKGIYFWKT